MQEDTTSLPSGFLLKGKSEYTIVSVLGKGGYGITYLAQSTIFVGNIPHKVDFAIKEFFLTGHCSRLVNGNVVFPQESRPLWEACQKEFRSEAEHLTELNRYPGIVPVNEVFEANGTVYYVMQHLGNRNLSDYVDALGGRLDETSALKLIELIGQAVDTLHMKKMVHLDIKPNNVMMVDEGGSVRPVLIDFGLSRHYNYWGKQTTLNGPLGVSDGYSPSEQYEGIDGFSPTADIYALAATLFRLLTGHKPERASRVNPEYLQRELQGLVAPFRIHAIIHAMAHSVEQRTPSVQEFLSELNNDPEATRSIPGSDDTTIPSSNATSSPQPHTTRLVVLSVMVGFVLALCVLLAVHFLNRPSDKQEVIADTTTTVKDTIGQTATTTEEHKVEEQKVEDKPVAQKPESSASQEVTSSGSQSSSETQQTEQTSRESNTLDLGYGVWEGRVKNGKPHGHGTLTYKTEHLVDSRDESGTMASAGDKMTGTMYGGHWESGTLRSASGSVKATFVFGAD